MIVAELIALLVKLPSDADVLLNWEGQLVHAKEARIADVHTYGEGGSISEDYYPEDTSCDVEEGGRKWRAVLID